MEAKAHRRGPGDLRRGLGRGHLVVRHGAVLRLERGLFGLRAEARPRAVYCHEVRFILRGGPDRLIPTLRKSLFDLDLECVDAYLVHFPRGDIDALAAALAEAVELGLTKRVGCSNFG